MHHDGNIKGNIKLLVVWLNSLEKQIDVVKFGVADILEKTLLDLKYNLITKVEWGVWREIKYVTKKFYFIEMKNFNLEVNQISYITCQSSCYNLY